MRAAVLAAIIVAPTAQPVSRAAAAPLGGCYRLVLAQDEVICYDRAGQVVSRTPVVTRAPGQPPPDPATLVEIPFLAPGLPGGGLCVDMAVVSVPGGPNSALAAESEQAWLRLMRNHRLCPGAPSAVPPVTAYVEAFIRTIALPVPEPRIAPGYGVAGKVAYLETRSTLAPEPVVQATAFGPLRVIISGAYFVHWGDEADPSVFAGPFSQEGQPWPAGAITHTWDWAGPVTIVVQARWTATWQLGPEQGALTGLITRATVSNFPVDALQAVIG
jgi:hypothetical protein